MPVSVQTRSSTHMADFTLKRILTYMPISPSIQNVKTKVCLKSKHHISSKNEHLSHPHVRVA